jgi:hypothetical protein
MRKIVTYDGTCLSCSTWARPSSMYSGVTVAMLVVSVKEVAKKADERLRRALAVLEAAASK